MEACVAGDLALRFAKRGSASPKTQDFLRIDRQGLLDMKFRRRAAFSHPLRPTHSTF
jgi:hypothetical protein